MSVNFDEKNLEEELKKKPTHEEDDDEIFIRKDQPEEEQTEEKEQESLGLVEKLKRLVFPKNNQQRNLARENGGLEADKVSGISAKDAWDDRSEEVDKMGSTDVFNSTGMRSVVWRKKKDRLDAKKAAAAAAAAPIVDNLKGKISVSDKESSRTNQGFVSRLQGFRQDQNDTGMSR